MDQATQELNHVQAMQSAKRGSKEVSRQQILDTTLQFSGKKTNTDWVEVNKLVKEKQTAVSNIMPPTKKNSGKVDKNKFTLPIPRIKKKCMKVAARQNGKTTPKDAQAQATKHPPPATLGNINNGYTAQVSTPIQLCGCRHGDLSVLKSFTKTEATYYTRPNRYLEGKGCLDCKCAILDMRPATSRQKAVVYYCDEGIKGFDAPDDDAMKAELTCNLVLCPQCEAIRRIAFERGNEGRRRGGRKRSRRN